MMQNFIIKYSVRSQGTAPLYERWEKLKGFGLNEYKKGAGALGTKAILIYVYREGES